MKILLYGNDGLITYVLTFSYAAISIGLTVRDLL
jgi:hypothetical protein